MSLNRGALGCVLGTVLVIVGCGGPKTDLGRPAVSAQPTPPSVPVNTAPQPGAQARQGEAVTPKPAPQLAVSPGRFTLATDDPGLQLVATLGAGAQRIDVTRKVRWTTEPAGVVEIDSRGYLLRKAQATGPVMVRAVLDTSSAEMTLTVAGDPERTWDFAEDIVPILTRAGCNTGSCHGRADGQNGFHLSLYGYDGAGDFLAVTHDGGGRRLSRFAPSRSLFLEKATGRIPHAGGQRLVPDSADYQTVVSWLVAGAPLRRGTPHGPIRSLDIKPGNLQLEAPGSLQLRVVATFADGHERDVTRLASYRVGDDSVLGVGPDGFATLQRRGEVDLVVRYQSQVVSTRLATLINPELKFDFASLKRRNFIDEQLFKRLESLRVPPSPAASDAVFLRRVSLDLTGEQPLPEQVRQFLADKDPEKRARLIDRLLASREFMLFWRIKFGDLLQISTTRFNNGASYYHTWLETQLEKNAPWDRSVHTLLTALGNPMEMGGGPVNYALDGVDPKSAAEQTAQRFLGLRLRCAQCHDHPFDVWTQDDYYGLAAFFAKVQRSAPGMMANRTEVKVNPKGSVEHLRTHRPAEPRLLDGKAVKVEDNEDPRKALADWIVAPENPYFARATTNWLWAQFFGKGIVDPADDLSKSNPPVHPELLDALAKHFVDHKYDIREMIRTIVTSEAYGLSSGTVPGNERDVRLFSHHIPRPLTAHQMADALAQATDVPNRFPNKPAQTRAIEVYDPSTASTILDTFGRCNRTVACATVGTPPLSLRQSLLLIGGDVIEAKVSSLNGYLANLLELNPEPAEIVENLYMRVVCRPPTEEELSRWSAELKQNGSLRDAAEDLFWALLNSREFAFNH